MSTKLRPIHQYPEKSLIAALDAVKNGMAIREASRRFNVPKTTIQDRIHGRIKEGPRKMGPPTILSTQEESELVHWLKELASTGFPRKKADLLNTVQKIVLTNKRDTPFKDGRPGEKWYKSFLKRHPDLALREPEGLTKSRAIITEDYIRKWFDELQTYIEEIKQEDIFNDPRRILNGDETSFSMCPKTGKVLAPKGWKNVYELKKGSEKEAITVLLVFSAAGKTAHPMVVFPYIRPPVSVVKSMPPDWFLGKSETGWMRSDIFYEYIVNGVNKWLEDNDIPKPVILFVDGHKSHMSMQLSKWCDENGIILYALPPNTTHIMQPADVSIFKPLKSQWKNTVRDWQSKSENVNSILNKTNFCPLLADCLKLTTLPETIINGFKRCGLFPLNPNAIDYSKCIQNRLEKNTTNKISDAISHDEIETTKKVLTYFKEKLLLHDINSDAVINILQNIYKDDTVAEGIYELDSEGQLILVEPQYRDLTDSHGECQNNEHKVQNSIGSEIFTQDNQIEFEPSLNVHIPGCDNQSDKNTTHSTNINVHDTTILKNNEDDNILNITEHELVNQNNRNEFESDLDIVSTPETIFKKHLFWPNPIEKNPTRKIKRERIPSAISSASYRQYLDQKENRKQRILDIKQKRLKARKLKAVQKNMKIPTRKQRKTEKNLDQKSNTKEGETQAIKCATCQDDLVSDVEEDELKNIGCDKCTRWFHLMCTEFVGLPYDAVQEMDYTCLYCS